MSISIRSLYEKYKRDVYTYLFGLTHNQADAEDLTSEVFVSAIKSLPNFQGKSEIKTWLFSIARYKWYETVRRDKKDAAMYEGLQCYMQNDTCSAENAVINAEAAARTYELLEKEKEQSKAIVFLRIDGYSFYEIAQKCNISESSARVIDFRVRKKLREVLTKEGFAHE
ncbi:MAG: RNA polymerase sigma factor [Oscillospiraceae bacterium]